MAARTITLLARMRSLTSVPRSSSRLTTNTMTQPITVYFREFTVGPSMP